MLSTITDGNTPHTIVKVGDEYRRVNEIGAVGGDPMSLETAETLINKQTGELMPMYRLQYKPGKDQIKENLLNPGTLPYIPPKVDEQTSPGPNASAQVTTLSTEVAMNRDRARSQPTVINLPIPGSQDGAVPKKIQHAPASLVPDWLTYSDLR